MGQRRARMETNLGKTPAIFNGHQPPHAVDPWEKVCSRGTNESVSHGHTKKVLYFYRRG